MDDFLYMLKLSLEGRIPQDEVDRRIKAYETFITQQLEAGEPLEKILRYLGDPTDVAELVIEDYFTQKKINQRTMTDAEKEEYQQLQRFQNDGSGGQEITDGVVRSDSTPEELNAMVKNPKKGIKAEYREKEGWKVRLGRLELNSWYGRLIIVGVIAAIFFLIKFAGA